MTPGQVAICFSLTSAEYERLAADGPRRDIALLAEKVGGHLLFRDSTTTRRGLGTKLFGPQIRHAWAAAREAERGGMVFADGEHVGFPLAAFLCLRGKRGVRCVILGHYVDKSWKRLLLRVVTRAVPGGVLALHSRTQADALAPLLPRGWSLRLLPYQVDTEFWHATPSTTPRERPLVVSAGSENRDYQTLIEAARTIDADFRIASGSHWARAQATAANLPPNVELLTQTLPFAALRELYAEADIVVVPLHPVKNQSGITTILEAMSMGKPVIVSATPGQREAVTGPLVQGDGTSTPSGRGPQLAGLPADTEATGLYVPANDPSALKQAIEEVIRDRAFAASTGRAARESAVRNFTVELFAERFAMVLGAPAPGHGRLAGRKKLA